MRVTRFLPATLCAVVCLGSCTAATDNGGNNGGGGASLTSITLSGGTTLAPDDSVDLAATGHYSDGSSRTLTDSVAWSSDNAAAVSVSNAAGTKGRAKWAGAGNAMISAAYSGQSGTQTITAEGVSALNVSPVNPMLDSGATQQLSAQASLTGSGGSLDATAKATWSSSDTGVAKVNNAAHPGLVTARGRGSATITASWKGTNGTTSVTTIVVDSIVVAGASGAAGGWFPIGGTMSLSARAYYSNSNFTDVTDSAAWSSSTGAMSVSSAGVVSRTGEDSSFIKATVHGRTGRVLLHKGCTVLADNLTFDAQQGIGVARLKVDGGVVVWLDNDGSSGAFRSVPAAGGSVTTIKSGLPYIGQWDMDANYIYWIWVNSQGAQDYYVVRLSRTSGVVDTLYSSLGLGGGSRGLAVDASYIYYAPGNDGGIRRMPVGGGAYTSFHNAVSYGPRELTLSGGVVYAAIFDASPNWIVAVPASGASVDTLGQAPNAPTFQQAAGSYFYVARSNAGPISRVPLGGGSVTAVASSNSAQGFAITNGYLYYTQTNAGSRVVRSPVAGGSVDTITDACGVSASTAIRVQYLATDGTYIYFTDDGGGAGASRVLRVKK